MSTKKNVIPEEAKAWCKEHGYPLKDIVYENTVIECKESYAKMYNKSFGAVSSEDYTLFFTGTDYKAGILCPNATDEYSFYI